MRRSMLHIVTAASALFAASSLAEAGDYSNASEYNHPYGMNAGQENQPVNSSLRDSNGNLTVVNGQFTSSTMSQQSGVQQMSAIGSSGSSNSSSMFATATAIGNSLNVVTTGSNNTVIVNSQQTNNGNQTATINTNGQ